MHSSTRMTVSKPLCDAATVAGATSDAKACARNAIRFLPFCINAIGRSPNSESSNTAAFGIMTARSGTRGGAADLVHADDFLVSGRRDMVVEIKKALGQR